MTENSDLVRRLEKLERENRKLKRWGGALIAVVGTIGLTSMAVPSLCKTVWAERFVLKDSSGSGRMMIDAYRSGAPVITASDESGKTFAKLTLDGKKPSLEFFNGEGKCTGKMGLDENGKPYVERSEADTVAIAR